MDWVADVLLATVQAWSLQPPSVLYESGADAASIAWGVTLLAALSTVLGQAGIFGINRISGWQLVMGVALGALYNAALRFLQAVGIGLLTSIVTGVGPAGGALALIYLFALAPYALGFLVFLPHVGRGIAVVLEGWTLLALIAILTAVVGSPWVALAIGGIIWVLGQVASRVLGRPLAALTSKVWTLATGRPTLVTANDILAGAPFVPLSMGEKRR